MCCGCCERIMEVGRMLFGAISFLRMLINYEFGLGFWSV